MPSDPTATLAGLVAGHHAVFDGLLAATDQLDQAAWATATGCPGWDVHDQLAHCVGLERRMLGDDEVDPHVTVPDAPHLTDDIKRHLERDVAARRGWPPPQLRHEAETTFARRRDVLDATSPAELGDRIVGPMGPMKLSAALRMRIFDLTSHERDIRGALGHLDGWAGPHVELTIEQTLRGWAARWADLADGVVRVEVAGAAPATIDLADGAMSRGADAGDGDAQVQLTAAQAIALAGGRADAPTIGELDIGGHAQLLTTLLARAAMTP